MSQTAVITVKSTSSSASERARIKKEKLERELVQRCDADLIRRQAYADRKAARRTARLTRRENVA